MSANTLPIPLSLDNTPLHFSRARDQVAIGYLVPTFGVHCGSKLKDNPNIATQTT
jgi:hypothetical protein